MIRPATRAALAVAVALTLQPARAADPDGRFAIEGGGLQTCTDYATAVQWRTADVAAYGGWIEGYLTALNQGYGGVYDLTPWQTTESLVSLLRSVCRQVDGGTRIAVALDRMVRLLLPQALLDESPVVAVQADASSSFAMYVEVLDRINAALRQRGHAVVDIRGHFGDDTRAGLRAVQAGAGLAETGLPDQRTLFVLLLGAAPVVEPAAAVQALRFSPAASD